MTKLFQGIRFDFVLTDTPERGHACHLVRDDDESDGFFRLAEGEEIIDKVPFVSLVEREGPNAELYRDNRRVWALSHRHLEDRTQTVREKTAGHVLSVVYLMGMGLRKLVIKSCRPPMHALALERGDDVPQLLGYSRSRRPSDTYHPVLFPDTPEGEETQRTLSMLLEEDAARVRKTGHEQEDRPFTGLLETAFRLGRVNRPSKPTSRTRRCRAETAA
jgi:hypothetical protein